MVSHEESLCPVCENILEVPKDQKEGIITCENCNSDFFFGRKQDQDTIEMANKYAIFVTPSMIALNEKVLEFNDLYPDNGLFDEATLQKTRDTIADLKKMLEEDGEEDLHEG